MGFEHQLESESYGSETRCELHRLQGEYAKIEYDRNLHSELKGKVAELLPNRNSSAISAALWRNFPPLKSRSIIAVPL